MALIAVTRTDDVEDTYEGQQVSFMTEPSGALVIYESQGRMWAAYSPSAWKQVNRGTPAD